MRCLVTGASGFVGRHLVAALQAAGHDVVGIARNATTMWDRPPGLSNEVRPGGLSHPSISFHAIDLLDTKATETVIRQTRPEWLFHLAGYANAGASFRDPDGAWAGNLGATRALYAAIRQSPVRPRILFVSSGLVYGDGLAGEQGFTEDAPLRPDSPYAVSKAAADLLSYQEARGGLDIVRVRPFNQIGPGQASQYAAANFARQIAAVELRNVPPILRTGDLTPRRDLTDVRDMVQAYIRLMEVGKKGDVYNAGSGTTVVVNDLLMRLLALSHVEVTIEQQADVSRFGDTSVSRADTTKLRTATGWQPSYSLDQSLHDILADWRSRTSKTSP